MTLKLSPTRVDTNASLVGAQSAFAPRKGDAALVAPGATTNKSEMVRTDPSEKRQDKLRPYECQWARRKSKPKDAARTTALQESCPP